MKSNKFLIILATFIILILTVSAVSAGGANDNSDIPKDTTLTLKISSFSDYIDATLKEGSNLLKNENITFLIEKNGKKINETVIKTDDNGVAKLDIDSFKPGKYHVIASFKGNDNYTNSSDDIDFEVEISKIPTDLELEKNKKSVSAIIKDNASKPISSKKINFNIKNSNGKVINETTLSTNSKGIATLDISSLSEGNYAIKAIFDGDDKYDSSYSNIIKLNIKADNNDTNDIKLKTYITIIPDIISNKYLSAILFDENGDVLANKVLTFEIFDKEGNLIKTKSVNTNENGLAVISLNGINLTNSSVSVSFSGDEDYNYSKSSYSFVNIGFDEVNETDDYNLTDYSDNNTGLLAYLSGLFGGLSSYLEDIVSSISSIISSIISKVVSLISGIINGIISFISNLINNILGFIEELFGDLFKILSDLLNFDFDKLFKDIASLLSLIEIIAIIVVIIIVAVILVLFLRR